MRISTIGKLLSRRGVIRSATEIPNPLTQLHLAEKASAESDLQKWRQARGTAILFRRNSAEWPDGPRVGLSGGGVSRSHGTTVDG